MERQKFPGALSARWEPYLGTVLGDWAPGEVVTFSVLALMVSAVSLSAVVVFGNSYLALPTWSFVLLLVIFSLAFLLTLFVISVHEQQRNTKTFQVRNRSTLL